MNMVRYKFSVFIKKISYGGKYFLKRDCYDYEKTENCLLHLRMLLTGNKTKTINNILTCY